MGWEAEAGVLLAATFADPATACSSMEAHMREVFRAPGLKPFETLRPQSRLPDEHEKYAPLGWFRLRTVHRIIIIIIIVIINWWGLAAFPPQCPHPARYHTGRCEVIAIDANLTVGGTGKTPIVEKFARRLRDAGRTYRARYLARLPRPKPPPCAKSVIDRLLFRREFHPGSSSDWHVHFCSIPGKVAGGAGPHMPRRRSQRTWSMLGVDKDRL